MMTKYKVIKRWKSSHEIGDTVEMSAINGHATTCFGKDGKAGIVAISFLIDEGYIEEIKESKVPDSWESLEGIQGYYVHGWTVDGGGLFKTYGRNKNLRPTVELAEACLAMSQLAQLRNKTWENCGNWKPDWGDSEDKHIIFIENGLVKTGINYSAQQFLSFPTEEIAIKFLEKHKVLIEIAKSLL